MSQARDQILGRIRKALGEERSPTIGEPTMSSAQPRSSGSRGYRRGGTLGRRERLDLLQDRIEDYRATLNRCRGPDLPGMILERLGRRQLEDLVIPSDIPDSWLEQVRGSGLTVRKDHDPQALSNAQLDSAHGVLTGCVLAIADSGTIVLNGGATQGRRALSLVPDYHLCVVFEEQVVESVPEAVDLMMDFLCRRPGPLTLISGPSATSDIELIRVEGVHGPRILDLILVEDSEGENACP